MKHSDYSQKCKQLKLKNGHMKKYIPILLLFAIFILAGCESRPRADFIASAEFLYPGEFIELTNLSEDATRHEWDFGDGTYSIKFSPNHAYAVPGQYTISLTVWNEKNESDIAFHYVTVEPLPSIKPFISYNEPYANEVVSFWYEVDYAFDYVVWDFGDGTALNYLNEPTHVFTKPGSYLVSLTPYLNNSPIETVYLPVQVYPDAQLEVSVLEYFDEYSVPNASVILYPSLEDWNNETNMVAEGITDEFGQVIFVGLGNQKYYLDILHIEHHNYFLAEEDVGFIATPVLQTGAMNYFTGWVDYVEPTQLKNARSRKALKEMKVKKFNRKFEDKAKK